jgi:hypothetical protein
VFDRNLQQDYCTCHWVYNMLAALQRRANDPHALQTFEQAAQKWEQLQSWAPAKFEVQRSLADTLNSIGRLHREAGRLVEARQALERARALMANVAGSNPGVPQYGETLSQTNHEMELIEAVSPPSAQQD